MTTVCDTALDVDVPTFVSPPYTTVMLWVPAESVDVVNVAMPLALSVPVPSVEAPSLNVGVPVGVPAPGAAAMTVAVNVTAWPNVDGLTEVRVKPVLEILRRGQDVGLLIDVNTLPDQGVFCDFFGIPACSTTGLAVFALRADAPVVPGFLIWDERLRKHRLRFEPEIPLIRTGDFKEEVQLNTAQFTKVIEECARRYPGQWLWLHKRWHTRPEGEPDLYRSEGIKRDRDSSMKLEVRV